MHEVSVIAIFYQVEEYARSCIESVLAQTFSDFELILVDDGSPDGCGAILDEYAARDQRIIVIHQENGGVSGARNAGLDVASGKYVYFLDGDDLMRPELLERAVSEMRTGIDMVIFDHEIIPEECSSLDPYHATAPLEFEPRTPEELLRFLSSTYVTCHLRFEVWGRMFRRSTIEQHNLRFFDNWKVFAEDIGFGVCYLAHGCHVRTIPDVLYEYRYRASSITKMMDFDTLLPQTECLCSAIHEHLSRSRDCDYLAQHFAVVEYPLMRRLLWGAVRRQVLGGKSFSSTREWVRGSVDNFEELGRVVDEAMSDQVFVEDQLNCYGKVRGIVERLAVPCITSEPTPRIALRCAILRVAGFVGLPLIKAYLRSVNAKV